MDILGALPPELSIRVLKYLTPIESIRLRLVSKSYHDLLTSEEVCSVLSRQFIQHEYNAAKKLDSWRLHYENHISRRLAYAFGKPWVTEHLPHMGLCSFCPETSYLAGVLGPARNSVEVLDLNTHPAGSVFPPTRVPNRAAIKGVILLPSFVVVVTQGNRGYSWNLKTQREYRFEIPYIYYDCEHIHGNGTLIAIPIQDSVVVHDVQAEKESLFKGIGNDTWMWGDMESTCHVRTLAIANSEKRVVWLFRELQFGAVYDQIFVVDSLHLETGEVVQGEVYSIEYDPPSCEDGPWQFWDTSWHPGPDQSTKNAQTGRIVFDARTGAWTEAAFTTMFPACVTESTDGDVYSRLIIRSGDLEYLIFGSSHERVRMRGQEPGDHLARADPLSPVAPAHYPIGGGLPFSCLGFCDKFLVGNTRMGTRNFGMDTGTVVLRFKGIHDCVG